MNKFSYPNYTPSDGFMTGKIQQQYIYKAVENKILPENAYRMANIVSLSASNDINQPIQFWQLYSVLGEERIVRIVTNFYERVFSDEPWFSRVFSDIAGIRHHVNTQAAMWIDVMGGGHAYHGGEFRLNFHHAHNAMELMNDKGAKRWVALMTDTLNDPSLDMTDDPRVRPAINTFLTHFMGKYAEEFQFDNCAAFGELNPPLKRKINFLNMSSDAIESLTEHELTEALVARGVDVSHYSDKGELVNKALRL